MFITQRLILCNGLLAIMLIGSSFIQADSFKIATQPTRQHSNVSLVQKSFYFIRHGETDWNIENRLQGQINVPLNDTGRAQAQSIQESVKNLDITTVYYSPLSRTQETMEIACKHVLDVPRIATETLMERNFGEWQGEIWNEAAIATHRNASPVHGESEDEYFERVVKSVNSILSEADGEVLIVAHGGTFWSICKAAGINYDVIQNCKILHFIAPSEMNENWEIQIVEEPYRELGMNISYYSQGDRILLKEWLDQVECVDNYQLFEDTIKINVSSQVSDKELLELVAIFDRYKLSSNLLEEFMHEGNKYWSSGKKYQVIYPHSNVRSKELADNNADLIRLECTTIDLYTQLDKNNMFEWMERLESVKEIVGVGPVIYLYLESKKISTDDMLELNGLFNRYSFDIEQLAIL